MSDTKINLKINGEKISIKAKDKKLTLLEYLRDELKLLATKNGCAQGHCGSCTVIIDGQAQRACLWRLELVEGSEIETIENLSSNNKLHPIQIAFVESGAIQCGFCTPGMVMAAKALLDKNPKPSKAEIKAALKNNLCRCTGYTKIIEAINLAAKYMKTKQEFKLDDFRQGIGRRTIRNDALEKVSGKDIYVDDLYREGMLYGSLHLSSSPHAKIKKIDIDQALAVEGVVKVITAEDIPGAKDFGLIINHQPVLAYDKVRYIGEPIAVVLAESKTAAEKGAQEIVVEYEELEKYYQPEAALADNSTQIHQAGNLLATKKISKGDYEAGFAEADIVVEDTYQTPFVEHAYLEPEGVLAEEINEQIVVWTPSQDSYKYQKMIANTLDLNVDKIRVINTSTGGAFGGREEPTVQIQAALAARLTQRAVKIVLTREESIRMSTKRHAAYLDYKLAATKEGEILAAKVSGYLDTGAYASAGEPVALRAASFALGPYEIPNVEVEIKSVYSNNIPAGAFRGFGSPQVAFAAESQMDKLATKLEIDPLELRLKNALTEGKATITGEILGAGNGFKECLLELKLALEKEKINKQDENKSFGWGIAGACKNVGLGSGICEDTEAIIELESDGSFTLYVGCVDSGQGSDTAMAQIAAETLGVDYQRINVIASDTAKTPDVGVTTGSRMIFLSGNAVKGAAEKLKDKLLLEAANQTNHQGEQLELTDDLIEELSKDNNFKVKYKYQPPETTSLEEKKITEISDEKRLHFAYCYAAHAVLVEIDNSSGQLEVLKVLAAHDTGRVINLQGIEGQIEGGVVMGLGYALSEEFYLEDGWPVQNNLARLGLLKADDIPAIESILIEEEHPDGPYQAKGMSELPVTPVAPALTNAINNAVGVRLNEIPINSTLQEILSKDSNN